MPSHKDEQRIGIIGHGPDGHCAARSGVAYNVGSSSAAMGGSYPKVGGSCGLIYLLGLIVIWWAPDTTNQKLKE
ncbi:MAG: hypothetical protein FJ405_19390 [Verrucomicrobia bacterium]|nr:hypothetical protein [Verrucomicrobiota bacterium]